MPSLSPPMALVGLLALVLLCLSAADAPLGDTAALRDSASALKDAGVGSVVALAQCVGAAAKLVSAVLAYLL